MRGVCLVVGVVLALLVAPSAAGQEPPEPPETPGPIGEIDVALSVEPSGAPTPPDGTVGQAAVTVTVTCTAVVVLTRPIEVQLADTGDGAAYGVTFDPPVINFTWDPPVCPEGSSSAFESVVSFRLEPAHLFRAPVPMRVEASSEHLADPVAVEWDELVGFAGTVTASMEPRIPVKTHVNNEVAVRVENDANAAIEYRIRVEGDFALADEVFAGPARVVSSALEYGDGIDYGVVQFVPRQEGDAGLLLHVTFIDPRDDTSVLREQLVSATIVSDPDHDVARAPERGGAPGPAAPLVVLMLAGLAVAWRRFR